MECLRIKDSEKISLDLISWSSLFLSDHDDLLSIPLPIFKECQILVAGYLTVYNYTDL